ncbi:hypothetical protein HanHA300_Chr12g0461211 [Helianthus annuus]|nr:hypothetical protein HanHA300_Chr12g0461211 [Helianthus annuus]KAJ0506833.1 hypothetical protein HanHA89_Chr12g0486611 [Helianthus annuus]
MQCYGSVCIFRGTQWKTGLLCLLNGSMFPSRVEVEAQLGSDHFRRIHQIYSSLSFKGRVLAKH